MSTNIENHPNFPTESEDAPFGNAGSNQKNDRLLKVDLSLIKKENLNESASHPQKTDFLEELNNREDEIRRMLYETQPGGTDRASLQGKTGKKAVGRDVIKTIQNEDEEECTFKPKLNAKTKKLINEKRQGAEPVNVILYKVALDKKTKTKEQEAELKQNVSKAANSNKISANSMKIILKKIEGALRNLIEDVQHPNNSGKINFENLGVILYRLGIFQNLEFIPQSDENVNRSSLSVNQSKVKPQRLTKEIAFHENFYAILDAISEEDNFIPAENVFRFLMVLVEDKTTVAESAAFLTEIADATMEARGKERQEGVSLFEKARSEADLWDMAQLVTEFRKLFNDKTAFMNTYAAGGVLQSKTTLEERSHETFKPQINPKSKDLVNKKQNENYEDKIKASVQEHVSPSKLQTRHDVLHEHHKYIKSKKHEDLETKLEQELANCTFKPAITEYKKPTKGPLDTNSSFNVSQMRYSQTLNHDLSKVKRHELLYEVARVQKEKLQQKTYDVKRQEEEDELAECTFKPKITSLSDESPLKLQEMQAGLPKGYKKTIERLKVAEKLREERKAVKEHIPRGENYEKIRNSDFKPPSFLSRPKSRKQEALVYVDVNIGPGKTGRIGIHKGDNAKTLAKNFAKTYSLPPIMKESLEKLLQSYIDSYFPETEASPENHEEEGIQEEQVHFEEEPNEEDDQEENGHDHGHGHEEEQDEDQNDQEQEEEREEEEENEEEN